jgi:hypothetical protein
MFLSISITFPSAAETTKPSPSGDFLWGSRKKYAAIMVSRPHIQPRYRSGSRENRRERSSNRRVAPKKPKVQIKPSLAITQFLDETRVQPET